MTTPFSIQIVENPTEKSTIADYILRLLPDWFGIEEAIQKYVQTAKEHRFYAVYEENQVIGFASVVNHNESTAEIHVMGILSTFHSQGVGTLLINAIAADCQKTGHRLLMVKTLGGSSPDPYYQRTRSFYEKVGFLPLEEMKEIWGTKSPCLLMVKILDKPIS